MSRHGNVPAGAAGADRPAGCGRPGEQRDRRPAGHLRGYGDLDGLAEQILAFEQHYNATARPFDWKFTRADLNQLLTRISRHDLFAPRPLAA